MAARSGALQTRDRYELRVWRDPGSAVHHFVLHRIRETLARRPVVTMAVEAVVGPAMAAADRRAPERLAVNRADDAAGDRSDRTCDHETDSRPGRGTDHV